MSFRVTCPLEKRSAVDCKKQGASSLALLWCWTRSSLSLLVFKSISSQSSPHRALCLINNLDTFCIQLQSQCLTLIHTSLLESPPIIF